MLNYHQIEFLAYERQKMFLEEAEQRRLQDNFPNPSVMHWLGARLVQWGLQLQGEKMKFIHQQPQQLVTAPD